MTIPIARNVYFKTRLKIDFFFFLVDMMFLLNVLSM